MQIARPLLLLLAFGLTHTIYAPPKTYASPREKAVKAAFEKIAAAKAAQCIQSGQQGSSKICSRPPIQRAIAHEKKKAEEFKARVDPKARILADIRAKEGAAARAAGHASVGPSVVILRNRHDAILRSPIHRVSRL